MYRWAYFVVLQFLVEILAFSDPKSIEFDSVFRISNIVKEKGSNGEIIYSDRMAKYALKLHWNPGGQTFVTIDPNSAKSTAPSNLKDIAKSLNSILSLLAIEYGSPSSTQTPAQKADSLMNGLESALKVALSAIEEIEHSQDITLKNKASLTSLALTCLEKILDPRKMEFLKEEDGTPSEQLEKKLLPQKIWQALTIIEDHILFFETLSPSEFDRLLYGLTITEDEYVSAFTKRQGRKVLTNLTQETRSDFLIPLPGEGKIEKAVNAMWQNTIKQYCDDLECAPFLRQFSGI